MTVYVHGNLVAFDSPDAGSPPTSLRIAEIAQMQVVTGSPPGPLHAAEGAGEIKNGVQIGVRIRLLSTDDLYDTLKTAFHNDLYDTLKTAFQNVSNVTFHAITPDGLTTADFIGTVLDWVETPPPGASAATPSLVTFVIKITDDNP